MALRLVVSMDAAPGKREELKAAFASICPSVREAPGCEEYEVFQSIEHPDRLILLERWTDLEALSVHGSPREVQLVRQLGLDMDSLRAGLPQVERYEA